MERPFWSLKNLLIWDTWWCGNNMLPARYLEPFLLDVSPVASIIKCRLGIALSVLVEIFGIWVITVGLLPWVPFWVLGLGALSALASHLGATILQSHSAALWQLQLSEALRQVRLHAPQVRTMLADRGFSEIEINALQTLPVDLYNAEVHSYTRTRLLMIGVPFACSCGLLMADSRLLATAVLGLGVLSVPLTEWYFRKRVRRIDEAMRIGRITFVLSYLRRALRSHGVLMVQIQTLGQLPLVLFLVRYAFGLGGDLLASYFAITQGLRGLTNSLLLQRQRTSAHQAVEIGRHLLEALASPALLVSKPQWAHHFQEQNILSSSPITDGVIIQDFVVSSMFPQRLRAISAAIPNGVCTLLEAPSGRGKTLLLLAIAHLIDHSGDLFFVSNGHAINAHLLGEQGILNAILIRQESEIDRASRLVDQFRPYLRHRLHDRYEEMKRTWGEELTEIVWRSGDSRLARLVYSSEILPWEMRSSVEILRLERNKIVTQLLKSAELALSPEKSYGSLSSGEKRRVLALSALTIAQCDPEKRLIILDEPFANLDRGGMNRQADVLQRIQETGKALLIVSHRIPENFIVAPIQIPREA